MIVIGLTGSIGMGKSETGRMFRRRGVPMFDSDAEVRRLTRPGGPALKMISEAFPGVIRDNQLDREGLGDEVFADSAKRKILEGILHPLVRSSQQRFLFRWSRKGAAATVIDIPLLFENQLEPYFDQVITVTAPSETQRRRVLERPGMNQHKLEQILKSQLPDAEKRKRADIIIDTGHGRTPVYGAVRRLIRSWHGQRSGALLKWRSISA